MMQKENKMQIVLPQLSHNKAKIKFIHLSNRISSFVLKLNIIEGSSA